MMEQLYIVTFTQKQLDFLHHYLDEFSDYFEEQTFDIVDTLKDAEGVYTQEELEEK